MIKINEFPNQLTSASAKLKEDFYIPSADYIINECIQSRGDISIKIGKYYDAVLGIYDKDTFKYVLEPYGHSASEMLKDFKLPGAIRNTSLIKPIINKKMARYMVNRPVCQVTINNVDVAFKYSKQLQSFIKKITEQLLINKMNEAGSETGMESKPVDIEAEIEKFKQNYADERISEEQDILDAYYQWLDMEIKHYINYYDWIVGGECYNTREIVTGELFKTPIRPDNMFFVENNNIHVDEYDRFCVVEELSEDEILERYANKLSTKDIKYLKELTNKSIEQAQGGIMNTFMSRYGYIYHDFNNDSFNTKFNYASNTVRVYTAQWKTYYKSGTLYRKDQFEQVSELYVDEDYVLQFELGDIEIDWYWLPLFFKVKRIGEKHCGLYIEAEPLEVQRIRENGKGCKSTITGKKGLFHLADTPSIVKDLMPYDILDAIYHTTIERIISKEVNNGKITVIPESLMGTDKVSKELNMYMMASDGRLIVDDSEQNTYAAAQLLKVLDSNLSSLIQDMLRIIEQNKQDAWDAVGWNRQIDGDIKASDGKSNTDKAINIAASSSAFADEIFNKFIERDLQCDLDYTKVVLIDKQLNESIGSFINEDGEHRDLKVDGIKHAGTESGIFVRNNSREGEKLDRYVDLAFSMGQNGEFKLAQAAIEYKNSTKIRKAINEWDALQQQYKQAEQENVTAQAREAIAAANERFNAELTSKEKISHEDNMTKLEIKHLDVQLKTLGTDVNTNSVNDASELIRLSQERINHFKMSFEMRKQNHKESMDKKNLELKNKQIDTNLKIATKNKNKFD